MRERAGHAFRILKIQKNSGSIRLAAIRENPMPQSFIHPPVGRRVANRALRARILATLGLLGELTSPEAALVAYGWPLAVRRRRLVPVIDPTKPQLSATRRALARLKADRIVVDAGRRRRRKVYRLRSDAELWAALTVGDQP